MPFKSDFQNVDSAFLHEDGSIGNVRKRLDVQNNIVKLR